MSWLKRLLTVPADERERDIARADKDILASEQVRARARRLMDIVEQTRESLRCEADDADRRLMNGHRR